MKSKPQTVKSEKGSPLSSVKTFGALTPAWLTTVLLRQGALAAGQVQHVF